MERQQHGLPVINHLLQHTLRSICTDSQWAYAVFWRILPRNYPPPKWDNETGFLDRSKGNKRNWILTWEDGFCDFGACVKASKSSEGNDGATESLQPELFFKMSHEVYSYGEGLMGKVASDSSHKWIFKDPSEQDSSFVSPWHGSLDPHPRTWESQFKAGIQTIAIVAVQEGLLQLGSLDKVFEDLNLVILLQRKFTYLQGIPGVFAPHPNTLNYMRPRLPLNHHHHQNQGTSNHRLGSYGPMLDDSLIGLNEQQRFNLLGLASRLPSYNQNLQDNSTGNATSNNTQLLAGLKRTCSSELTDDGTILTTTSTTTSVSTTPNGRQIPERPPLSKSLNTGHSPPGVVPHLQPSMSSLHALLSKLPSVSSLLGPTTTTPAPASSSPILHQTSALSRSLSMPRQFTNQLHFNEDYRQQQQQQQQHLSDVELATKSEVPTRHTQNLTCRTGSTGSTPSTKMSILPDASRGYIDHFEAVSDYGIHSELDAYNSLLSEIHQLI